MNRAELRRQQRTSTKGKATYTLTRKQIEDMKQEIYEKASKQALILMLAIPCEVLANDYWTKTAKQRLPEFVEKCLSLFSSFEKGAVTLEEMNEDLWELAGYRIER